MPVINGKRISPDSKPLQFTLLDNSNTPVGLFQFFNYNIRNRSGEFGYRVNPAKRGMGAGTELLKLGINKLFSDDILNLNKIYCQTGFFNIQSIKLLEQ